MSMVIISFVLIAVLLLFLGAGLWVALSLLLTAIVGLMMIGNDGWGNIMATISWSSVSSWTLTPLPMFIWMGEILFRSNLSKNLFDGLSVWLNRIPGKLYHVNILSCGVFSAVSGSSAATVATVGNITLTHLKRLGYRESFSMGLLGGSGTLGLLIPPSIMLIIYGVSADISVARLFMAGVFPGLLLICLFMGYTIIYCLIDKTAVPEKPPVNSADATEAPLNKLQATIKLFPVLLLITLVLGSIYTGFASPSEAASLGVLAALFLALIERSLTLKSFTEGLLAAAKTSSMLLFIIVCASVLSNSMGFVGLPRELALFVKNLNLSPGMLIIILSIMFIILGCFLDGISVVLLTTAIILPLVKDSGIDLIWFGIYLVLVVEMSQITPPVGFNLFVLQGLTGKDILTIAKYTIPFFFLILLSIFILWLFPEIATWLPTTMTAN